MRAIKALFLTSVRRFQDTDGDEGQFRLVSVCRSWLLVSSGRWGQEPETGFSWQSGGTVVKDLCRNAQAAEEAGQRRCQALLDEGWHEVEPTRGDRDDLLLAVGQAPSFHV